MKKSLINLYEKIAMVVLILFICYILSSSSFYIIDPQKNYNFLTILLNLVYLIFSSIVFLIFSGILFQILLDFKMSKNDTTLSHLYIILRSNWYILILWFCNILLISFILFFSQLSLLVSLKISLLHEAFYLFCVILCYGFYALTTFTFIITLIMFRLYIAYIKNISSFVHTNHWLFFKEILENEDLNVLASNETKYFKTIIFINTTFDKELFKESKILASWRKTIFLTLFKKQTSPPAASTFN